MLNDATEFYVRHQQITLSMCYYSLPPCVFWTRIVFRGIDNVMCLHVGNMPDTVANNHVSQFCMCHSRQKCMTTLYVTTLNTNSPCDDLHGYLHDACRHDYAIVTS